MRRVVVRSSSLPNPGRNPVTEEQDIEATGRWTRTPDAVQGSGDGALGGSAGAAYRAVDDTITTSPVPWTLNLLRLLTSRFRPPADATGTTGERSAYGGDEGPRVFAAVLVILPYVATVVIGILAEFDDTVARWSAAAKVAYCLTAVLTVALMVAGVTGVMAAVERGDRTKLSSLALSAKLGVFLSGVLLVVSFAKKMGPWGRVAGTPSAAVLAAVVLVVWNYRAVAQAAASTCRRRIEDRLRRQRRGDDITLPVTTPRPDQTPRR